MAQRICVGLVLIGCFATVHAESITIPMAATIVAVHCTAEQRTRIRACATPDQQTSTGPYKTLVSIEPRGQHEVGLRQEVKVDPSRQVIIKTLLY